MSSTYTLIKLDESASGSSDVWNNIPVAAIENCLWEKNGYSPRTEAKAFYTEEALHIILKSYEKEIKAVYENMNDSVCKDSCLEFFINPAPEVSNKFLNFEFNPLGTLLLGLGKDRHKREDLCFDYRKKLNVKTLVNKNNLKEYSGPAWFVEFTIPFEFLREIYGPVEFKSGKVMKGNFYKCGDDTTYPHYLTWSNILSDVPDFHTPEFFGDLILE